MHIPDTSPPAEAAQADVPFEETPPDGKPKRTRRTRAEMDAARKAEEETALAGLPPFHFSVSEGHVTVTAERQLRVGQYEHYLLRAHADFTRDPRFKVEECIHMLGVVVVNQIEELVAKVQREIQFEK